MNAIVSGSIFGIWFYDKDECARIGQLMNSLVQVTLDSKKDNGSGRQRRASESDTLLDTQRPAAVGARGNVDILQMLSKAQDEYDKVSRPNIQVNNMCTRTRLTQRDTFPVVSGRFFRVHQSHPIKHENKSSVCASSHT